MEARGFAAFPRVHLFSRWHNAGMKEQKDEQWRVGIDAGSKTIKVVVLDEYDHVVYSLYQRHRSNIRDTLRDLLHELIWINGDLSARVSVTGSAGINVSKLLGVPFVQEVVATTEAVRNAIPDADAIVELGGEDAKVVYLTGGMEQRMNATCAGGTGGFIDTIAFMLGVRTSEMSTLAMGAQRTYPIASRCAVFAQTDVRPLLNEGASKADIAASVLDAVVRQTLGGLACGRPLRGKVVFLGGPFQYIPELVNRFRRTLGLTHQDGVKPADAHLFPAMGAALLGAASAERVPLSHLEALLADGSAKLDAEGLPRLAPLFSNADELEAFRERHGQAVYPTKRAFDAEGPIYLGVDAGSTTVKLALIDAEGNLLHSDYQPSRGDVIQTVRDMLLAARRALPKAMLKGRIAPYIAHGVATGYGEEMLIRAFGMDSGTVETMAHVRAAQHFCPDATFVLDIGGQDMKALWLSGGYVSDAVLNEACSSGCGAFIEGTAHGLHATPAAFASLALEADAPVDLGTRCTVFMSSRVKHAQKVGASVADIAAGAAYSIVNNALFRIIGAERTTTLGEKVVVQGGTFKSDAVLRAFELTCGVEAIRPDRAHLMGAIGAALIARDRALQGPDASVSTLATEEELEAMEVVRRTEACTGCANACKLTIVDMGKERRLVTGNRCDACPELSCGKEEPAQLPNLIAREQALLKAPHAGEAGAKVAERSSVKVGVIDGLELYRFMPFWRALVSELGLTALLPSEDISTALRSRAWETVPAESACYPAKLVHAKAHSLRDAGADALLFPDFERRNHCAVACGYVRALRDSVEWLRDGSVQLVAAELSSVKPKSIVGNPKDIERLIDAFAPLCERAGMPLEEGEMERALKAALEAQCCFERTLAEETKAALTQVEADPDARGVLVVGRPYHVDPAVMHGVDQMLGELGFTVFGMTGLGPQLRAVAHRQEGLPEWRAAKRLMKAAQFVVDHPQVELVCLQSFGCGYDAASLEEVREYLEAHGRPFTSLKLDEMVETAHIRIRLRTLAESIRAARQNSCAVSLPGSEESLLLRDVGAKAVRLLDEPLSDEDLAVARTCTVKDACFTANVLAARAIRRLREDPDIETVVVPKPCSECLCDAIPRMVERACGHAPRFVWEEGAGSVSAQGASIDPVPLSAAAGESKGDRPKIGIIGNPLLVFEPYMNDGLVDLLEGLGCEAVLPEEDALYTEDVRYLDQLQRFAELGVAHVIYLQSFGCVKGHVQARGAHYELADRFPDMPVTVLDYDPEASALNRENRVRLIAESVGLA